MEFHENKAKQPFIGFVLIWRAYKAWRLRAQTRRLLQQMSDETSGCDAIRWSDFLSSAEAGGYRPASFVFMVFINSCF